MTPPRDRIKSRVLAPTAPEPLAPGLLYAGVVALILALAGLGAMAWLTLTQEGGAAAVALIAGLAPIAPLPSPEVQRLALAADFLLPIGYAAGFCLMAAGLANSRARAALAFLVGLFVLLGLAADLTENALILAGQDASVATLLKFGGLAIGAFMLAALFPGGVFGVLVRIFGWGLTPLALAATMSGLPQTQEPLAFTGGLALAFLVLILSALAASREAP